MNSDYTPVRPVHFSLCLLPCFAVLFSQILLYCLIRTAYNIIFVLASWSFARWIACNSLQCVEYYRTTLICIVSVEISMAISFTGRQRMFNFVISGLFFETN